MEVFYLDWTPSEETMKAVDFGIHALCLDQIPEDLFVTKETDPRSGVVADCYHDGLDEYEVRLWAEDTSSILHELVHVMQYANYELEVYSEGKAYWQGQMYDNLTYVESPWEIEAFRLETILLESFEKHTVISS